MKKPSEIIAQAEAARRQPRAPGGRFGAKPKPAPPAESAPLELEKTEEPSPWREALVLYQLAPAAHAPAAHQCRSLGLTAQQARSRSRVLARDAALYVVRRFVLLDDQHETLAELIATDNGDRPLSCSLSSNWKVTGANLVAALKADAEPF